MQKALRLFVLLWLLSPILGAMPVAAHPHGIAWFEKAAEAGDVEAQYRLARIYAEGIEVEADLGKAKHWLTLAAEGGHRAAQFDLATMLLAGEGGVRNVAQAEHWFRKAAEAGHVAAKYNLALLLLRQGESKTAAELLTDAALAGVEPAAAELAILFLEGRGVERDEVMALAWLLVAADSGTSGAEALRGYLESRLSEIEMAAAIDHAAALKLRAAAGPEASQ